MYDCSWSYCAAAPVSWTGRRLAPHRVGSRRAVVFRPPRLVGATVSGDLQFVPIASAIFFQIIKITFSILDNSARSISIVVVYGKQSNGGRDFQIVWLGSASRLIWRQRRWRGWCQRTSAGTNTRFHVFSRSVGRLAQKSFGVAFPSAGTPGGAFFMLCWRAPATALQCGFFFWPGPGKSF